MESRHFDHLVTVGAGSGGKRARSRVLTPLAATSKQLAWRCNGTISYLVHRTAAHQCCEELLAAEV